MFHWRLRCFPSRRSLLLVGALLASCAGAPPVPAPLLEDALFGNPPRPAEADSALAADDAMREHVRRIVARTPVLAERPKALADSLAAPGDLRLDYDASFTRNAAQAFAARSGNCLSLVLMTAALAREMGLDLRFQRVLGEPLYSRQPGLTLRSGHVNLVLGVSGPARRAGARLHGGNQWVIDFMPGELSETMVAEAIEPHRVLAMFMNNRAVESLLAQQPASAYAWAREALRTDPAYWDAYNTLGVVYRNAGHPGAAAAVFETLLAHDARNVAAMTNLEGTLAALGRAGEAAGWSARRQALEPYPPFHFLHQGQRAMARQDPALALRLFERELALSGPSHESYFWLAQARLALGQADGARQALQQALEFSTTPGEQRRYAGKLDALRRQALR
ncbi:MAG: tetratricopeptide repeat protein [Burkholderiaceae bacterium]|nr:tetratricopeptide repeat protein [Burkholderiaceae bacterium]